MKHSEVLDILEPAVALARAIQTGDDAERAQARLSLEKAIGLLKSELDNKNPPVPDLNKRLADCVIQIVRIDFH